MGKYRPKLPPLDPCPIEHIVKLVGGKWKARILYRLSFGDASLAELEKFLPRIRTQVLAAQLQAMIGDGLVNRREAEPPQTWGRFEITGRGRGLYAALDAAAAWGANEIGGWVPPALGLSAAGAAADR